MTKELEAAIEKYRAAGAICEELSLAAERARVAHGHAERLSCDAYTAEHAARDEVIRLSQYVPTCCRPPVPGEPHWCNTHRRPA